MEFPVSEYTLKVFNARNLAFTRVRSLATRLARWGLTVRRVVLMPEGPMSPRNPIHWENGQWGVAIPVPEDVPMNYWLEFESRSGFAADARQAALIDAVLRNNPRGVVEELLQATGIVGEGGEFRTMQDWLNAQPEVGQAYRAVFER